MSHRKTYTVPYSYGKHAFIRWSVRPKGKEVYSEFTFEKSVFAGSFFEFEQSKTDTDILITKLRLPCCGTSFRIGNISLDSIHREEYPRWGKKVSK